LAGRATLLLDAESVQWRKMPGLACEGSCFWTGAPLVKLL